MVSTAVSEMILVAATLTLGLVLFGLVEAYVVPSFAFNQAVQQAKAVSQTVFLSISPPAKSSNTVNFLVYPYTPSFNGNISVILFTVNSSYLGSISVLTPSLGSTNGISITLPNGKTPKEITIGSVYSTNGKLLAVNIQAYSLPTNEPFNVTVTYSNNTALIVWIVYYSGGYYFLISYSYQVV